MVETSSKNIIFWIITIVSIIVATLSISFAFFMYLRTGENEQILQSGTLKMRYDASNPGISLNNVSPISDEAALNDEDFSFLFSVDYVVNSNAKITYGIYLEDWTNNLDEVVSGPLTSFSKDKVKVALEDVTNQSIVVNPIFYSEVEENTFIENVGYLLYSRTVAKDNIDTYRVYMWIPEKDIEDNDITSDNLFGKTFSFMVNVKAIASVNE